ncbi:MAG: helix-turn-helix transcriptional regulator [Clostridia bacterium]|nr:helix-turn-helix transcriptional regulator [Clostridia bacterium]
MAESFSGMTTVKFSERLRLLRRQAKLTQQAVADYLQIHRTTYTKYETRCVTPDQEGLVRLATLFGVTVDYLLGCPEKEPEPQMLADGEPRLQLTEQEMQLVLAYRKLDSDRRREILEQTETLRPTEE